MNEQPHAYSYIRFSTPPQQWGDSERRQLETARQYASKHNLALDESTTMFDRGVSAFTGANVSSGALSVFLNLVKKGKIPRGSMLLLENLDRLTRQNITDGLTTFFDILKAGVDVVTLMDGRRYSKTTIDRDIGSILQSTVHLFLANEASQKMSSRLKSSWANKRALAAQGKAFLTRRCPAWLRPVEGKNGEISGYEEIKERADVVRQIFGWTRQGRGKQWIAQELTAQGVEAWAKPFRKKESRWYPSYISKILYSPTPAGMIQMCLYATTEAGKRVNKKDGEPIEGYYPAVIAKQDWLAVQARRQGPRGRTVSVATNLFTKLLFDGYTGETMTFCNKSPKKNKFGDRTFTNCYLYLTSSSPVRPRATWNYLKFESAFLEFADQLDWGAVMQVRQVETDTARQLEAARQSVADAKHRRSKLIRLIETADAPPEGILARISELEAKLQVAEQDAKRLAELDAVETEARQGAASGIDAFRKLIKSHKHEEARLRLREEIKKRVARVELFPQGYRGAINSANAEYDSDTLPTFHVIITNSAERWISVDHDNEPVIIDISSPRDC